MKKIIMLLLAGYMILLSACSKKEGCTINSATNYCDDCEKDDGSCTFSGQYVPWWKQAFRDSCAAYGIANIQVFLDGSFQGTLPVSAQYWTSAPACGSSATLTITKTWQGTTAKDFNAYIKLLDGSGNVFYTSPNSTVSFTANGCRQEEITW